MSKKEKEIVNQNEAENVSSNSKLKDVIEFLTPIIVALIIAIVLKTFIFANAVVPTGSMLQTIQEKDRVIASRIAYEFGDPQRYDIAIFKFPDDESQYYVKRVIGLPGETVNIVDGKVFVTGGDGKTIELDDSFVAPDSKDYFNGSYVVPEDSYFMLGDNRVNSVDSRYWVTTNYVSKDKFVGKVVFRYFPFNTAGKLK